MDDVGPQRLERPQTLNRMGPLHADHPLVRDGAPRCPGCGLSFAVGDVVTLLTVGPGADPDERARAAAGSFFNAVALAVHWACATGFTG